MTLGKKQKSLLDGWSWKSQLSYDETLLVMQVTYRPYKRASVFRVSSLLELTQLSSTIDVQPEALTA
jgi:hypothetical protein